LFSVSKVLKISWGSHDLISDWWFLTILKNISQWEGLSHISDISWKIKHVPNHQPVYDGPNLQISWQKIQAICLVVLLFGKPEFKKNGRTRL
jgi:hypothetical protein